MCIRDRSLEHFYAKNNIENKIFSFEKNFFSIIQQADLCITRAGASSLAAVSCSGDNAPVSGSEMVIGSGIGL